MHASFSRLPFNRCYEELHLILATITGSIPPKCLFFYYFFVASCSDPLANGHLAITPLGLTAWFFTPLPTPQPPPPYGRMKWLVGTI
jgi:hypothetical protein